MQQNTTRDVIFLIVQVTWIKIIVLFCSKNVSYFYFFTNLFNSTVKKALFYSMG